MKFNKISRNSETKFQVHLSSTKAMFQYMTISQLQKPSAISPVFVQPRSECGDIVAEYNSFQ